MELEICPTCNTSNHTVDDMVNNFLFYKWAWKLNQPFTNSIEQVESIRNMPIFANSKSIIIGGGINYTVGCVKYNSPVYQEQLKNEEMTFTPILLGMDIIIDSIKSGNYTEFKSA